MTAQKGKSWYSMKARPKAEADGTKAHDVFIQGYIGYWDITAREFIQDLQAIPSDVSTIHLHLNSGGGEVFDGIAIYHALKAHKAQVHVYIAGLAGSIATVIAMAGDKVTMTEDSYFMVHKPSYSWWNADDLREIIAEFTKDIILLDGIEENLVAIYTQATGLSTEDAAAMVQATTWLKASEAKEKGFITDIGAPVHATASLTSLPRGVNIPDEIRAMMLEAEAGADCGCNKAPKAASKKSLISSIKEFLGIGTPKAGATLGEILNNTITSMETEQLTRETIIADMAAVTAQTTEAVQADIDGSNTCPTLGTIAGYSMVLTTTYAILKAAAEADGCDFSTEEEAAKEEAEAKSLLKPMMDKVVAAESQLAATGEKLTKAEAKIGTLTARITELEAMPQADATNTVGDDLTNGKKRVSNLSAQEQRRVKAGQKAHLNSQSQKQ